MHRSPHQPRRPRRVQLIRFLVVVSLLLPLGLAAAAEEEGAELQNARRVFLPFLIVPGEPSATATSTATATATATATRTATSTATNGPTSTATSTATNGPTSTATSTATNTPTSTATNTPTSTATNTPTNTPTSTATNTPTNTPTSTATSTPTSTPQPAQQITWRQVANYPRVVNDKAMGNSEGHSIVLNNRLYVFGGYEQSTYRPMRDSYIFNPSVGSRGEWTRIADLPLGNTHGGIATDGRYIYLVAGYMATSVGGGQTFGTVNVYRYDPEANVYVRLRDLPTRSAAGIAAVVGDQLHYLGGTNPERTREVGDHWSLDLSNPNAQWQTRASLPNPRHHMGSVVYGGKIYVIGGQHKHDGSLIPQDDVHVYDPATNTWAQLADLPEGRNHITSTTFVLNDEVYVLGGQYLHEGKTYTDANGNQFKEVPRDTVFVYNFARNQWREVQNPLPVKRHSAVGGAINGKLYFSTGGFSTATYEGSFAPVVTGAQP